MGEKFPPLDLLAKAAKDRRDARRALRDTTRAFAGKIANHLRRGDEVVVGNASFLVENVTWWVGDPPHDGIEFLCPDPAKALIRKQGDREVILSDPRRAYVDEGFSFRPAGEWLFRAAALADEARVTEYELSLPSDDELLVFISEAPAVVAAFAELAEAEADELSAAARRLQGGSNA
jgi:hypothetical protein